uniref:BRCA2 DNA repair associated n=1 Tax=Myripristis murdjan TaxID=586833 RepID=A0A667XXS1_9TELE
MAILFMNAELGPLDPNWFDALMVKTDEENVSEQDNLRTFNQDGHFKAPFEKTAVDSQLFSTPKIFRHGGVQSPETEDEQFFSAESPWTVASPCLFGTVDFAQHISESLGAQIHPDISWTSSLNTPPAVPSTLILCEHIPFILLFICTLLLDNAILIVVLKSTAVDSPGPGQDRNSHESTESSLNQSNSDWKQTLPDAIEDGEIRSTVARVLDGAENVLSIFFTNSSSALRRVKTDRIKRKQSSSTKDHSYSSTNISTTNSVGPSERTAEQRTDDLEVGRVPSSPHLKSQVKAGNSGNTQWSPLSLSEISHCAVDTTSQVDAAKQIGSSVTAEQLGSDSVCGQLVRPSLINTDSMFTKKKRRFVYTIQSAKSHLQGKDMSTEMESSPGNPLYVTRMENAPDEAQCYNRSKQSCDGIHEMQKQENVAKEYLSPSVPTKSQDLDMSQLCRAFAQDFTPVPDSSKLSNVEDTHRNGFSPSACLSALRQRNKQKSDERVPHLDRNGISDKGNMPSTYLRKSKTDSTVSDSGFQSFMADVTPMTASSSVLPSIERGADSQPWPGFKTEIHRTAPFESATQEKGMDNMNRPAAAAELSTRVIEQSQTVDLGTETNLHTEVSVLSVHASGFKTASNRGVKISKVNLERAKNLFKEINAETSIGHQPTRCSRNTEDETDISHISVESISNSNHPPSTSGKCGDLHCPLTASQKADVTELCSLLEEADSQFEFTQFRTAKQNQHSKDNASLSQTADKDLDPDFLSGIDFDDSFSSDAEKHVAKTMTPNKVTSISHCKMDCTAPSIKSKSMFGVGFKTAGGNVLKVSNKYLSKARALFADLEENPLTISDTGDSSDIVTKNTEEVQKLPHQQKNCEISVKANHQHNVDNSTDNGDFLHSKEDSKFTGNHDLNTQERIQVCFSDVPESPFLDRHVPDIRTAEHATKMSKLENNKMDTSSCQSGFQMASGKGISVSAKAIQEASAFFKDCVAIDSEDCMSKHKKHITPVTGMVTAKKNISNFKGVKVNICDESVNGGTEFENVDAQTFAERHKEDEQILSGGYKNTLSLTNSVSFNGRPSLIAKQSSSLLYSSSKDAAFSNNGELSNAKGFCTPSGKKVSVSDDAVTKAKSLLSECHTFEDRSKHKQTADLRAGCQTSPIPTLPPQNGGFQTASGKGVAVSAVALKKAQALLSEYDGVEDEKEVRPEVRPILPNNPNADPPPRNNGFCTASGKKVSVSDDAMTKAKSLLNEYEGYEGRNQHQHAADSRAGCQTSSVPALLPQNGGFQTASGKGVAISTMALKKAQALLSEYDGVEDEKEVRPIPNNPICDPPPKDNGFCTASGKKVTVSDDAMTKAKSLLNEASSLQNGGFQTASGKGVAVSAMALKKAKALLSDYDGVENEKELLPMNPNTPIHEPLPRNGGFSAASGKPVAFSAKALQKAEALFSDINSTTETPAVSDTWNTDSNHEDASKIAEKIHCTFTTARGTKVNVSEKNLLKAKNLLNEFVDAECPDSVITPRSYSAGSFDIHKSEIHKVNICKITSTSDLNTTSQKDMVVEEIVPQVVITLLSEADLAKEAFRNSTEGGYSLNAASGKSDFVSEKASKEAFRFQEGTGAPSGQDNLQVMPGEERPTIMDCGVNRTSGSETHQFIRTDGSSVLNFESLDISNCTDTQQLFFAQEAMDCTKALLEDEDLAGQSRNMISEKLPLHDNPKSSKESGETQKTSGKRSAKDSDMTGQPPLKRRLLEEFDRTVDSPRGSTLHPAKSCPDGVTTDRRVFKFKMIANFELARDMQDMRIRKKKRQTIRPLSGSLFLAKTSGVDRIRLKDAVNGQPPAQYTQKQLYGYGVHRHVTEITSDTAESFRFSFQQFFRQEVLADRGGVQLADGGWLIPRNDGTAGKEEFYRALCDSPGVDPKLISEDWVYNHYRWIVWKQASMERSFPATMAGLCLNPEQVLLQLKYRYDVEVDHSRRPALRKIMEKDDTAAKTLVLCVCGVVSRGHDPSKTSRNDIQTPQGADSKVENPVAVVWLTDGWYAIKAQLDVPLTAMLHKGRLAIGGKLIIHGAELVGSQDACPPLEAPESVMLKICANSSRPARWDTKLGFHRDPRPFLLPVSCLYSNGGTVGCVDIVILRSYPIQWMERKPDGGFVFRCDRAEEKEARRYNNSKHKAMEILFAKIQAEFEKEDKGNKPRGRRRTLSRQDIENLQDGEELHEAARLSEQQLETLHSYRRSLAEKKQAELQERYRRALDDAQESELNCPKRDVTPVWRLCIADSRDQLVCLLSIWRPSTDLQSFIKEGCRYRVYNLTTSEGKRRAGFTSVQLTATKKTQFQDLQASQEWLSAHFQPRISANFLALQNPEFHPLCGEIDLVGHVIAIIDGQGSFPVLYLVDGKLKFVKVHCCSSLAQTGLEDVVKPLALLALSNLQLRAQSSSPIPTLYAGDLTVFSTNPKEAHLQEAVTQLRNLVQEHENFFTIAEERLSHFVRSDSLSSIPSPALQPRTPGHRTDRKPDTRTSPARSFGSFTPLSRKTPPVNSSSEKDPKLLKRRRALEYLSHVPSPPPLCHLGTAAASPCVNKTFNPPRRSGTASTLKTAQTPVRKPVVLPPDDEWVNDEELAMIDTQALHGGDLSR